MATLRRPWLAALLSLFGCAGLGQLYNGTPRKAVAFMVGLPIAGAALLWTTMWAPGRPLNLALPLLALLGLQAWCALDAARDARRLGDRPRPWHSRWYVCLAVWAFNLFLLLPGLFKGVVFPCVQSFAIPTGGMEHAVLRGDRVLADKRVFGLRLPFLGGKVLGGRKPRREDVVIFLYPENRRVSFLKRVIGLPGEKIEVRGKTVFVNDAPLSEPYVFLLNGDEGDLDRGVWGPETVPEGHLFVLGDNRDNSRDSRMFGFVPVADVLGVARVVYYSRDDRAGPDARVRWDRIGLSIR